MNRWASGLLGIVLSVVLCACDEMGFYSMFPPDDYYDPLLTMTVSQGSETYSGNIVHRYKGLYSISLTFDKANAVGDDYGLAELDIKCSMKHLESIIDIPCGSELLPFWGKKSGISLGVYRIPETVPKNERMEFNLVFKAPAQLREIESKYGPIALRIEKWSDM